MAENVASVRNPVFARMLTRLRAKMDPEVKRHFGDMLAGLEGRVLELGAGSGPTFALYPPEVDEVVAIEPEPYLRARAAEAAERAPVPITVRDGVAERLPAEDESFDAAVVAGVLCTVRDPHAALRELHRVVRPGGELRFYEHVLSEKPGLARAQRVATRSRIWPLVGGGCHADRDTLADIERAGFEIERRHPFDYRPCIAAFVVTPHVIGVARRP